MADAVPAEFRKDENEESVITAPNPRNTFANEKPRISNGGFGFSDGSDSEVVSDAVAELSVVSDEAADGIGVGVDVDVVSVSDAVAGSGVVDDDEDEDDEDGDDGVQHCTRRLTRASVGRRGGR